MPVRPNQTNSGMSLKARMLAEKSKNAKSFGPHVMVVARAGTGKTTMVIEGLKKVLNQHTRCVPSEQQALVWEQFKTSVGGSICLTAFSSEIVTTLGKRAPFGVAARGIHQIGYKAVRRSFKLAEGENAVDGGRVAKHVCELLNKKRRQIDPVFFKAATSLTSLCKTNLLEGTPDDILRLVRKYDIDCGEEFEFLDALGELVPRLLERSKDVETDECIDFDDMVWLPLVLDLAVDKYDTLIVDESQDLTPAQQELCFKIGTRLIFVGDDCQAIFGFMGADTAAIKNLRKRLEASEAGCVLLPLTVSYRCPKAVVAAVQDIVPDYRAHENNPEGRVLRMTNFGGVHYQKNSCSCGFVWDTRPLLKKPLCPKCRGAEVSVKEGLQGGYDVMVRSGDAVLARTNAVLVREYFKFLKRKSKAVILGRKVGQVLVKLAKSFEAKSVADFNKKLQDWYLEEYTRENSKEHPDESMLERITDHRDCLVNFSSEAKSIEQLLKDIDEAFSDSGEKKINLATFHKSKGLEFKNVFFLNGKACPAPHPAAKTAEAYEQERYLIYVGKTRAMETLALVDYLDPEDL